MQCFTYQTEWNVRTCKKETKHALFWGVKTHSVLGCAREGISLPCRQITRKVPKTVKTSLSYSFGVVMGHFDMVRWKYDSVCISSMSRNTLELILWKKADEKCKDQRRSFFFAKGALIGKSMFQVQRNKRCSRQVLQHRCSWWYFIKFYT